MIALVETDKHTTHSPKVRITDRTSREALAAILRELRYQRRRAVELAAMCDHGLARIELSKSSTSRRV